MQPLKTLKRAKQILDLLAQQGQLSLTEIEKATGFSHTTTYRLLMSLVDIDLAVKGGKDYAFHWRLIADQKINHSLNWTTAAIVKPFVDQFGLTAYIGIIQGGAVMIADVVPRTGRPADAERLGEVLPVNASALGKCAVAFLQPAEQVQLERYAALKEQTKYSITDLAAFRQSIKVVQHNGFAIDDQETEIGLRCVAVPLYDRQNCFAAVLALAGDTAAFPRTKFIQVKNALLQCQQKIMQNID
jgi:DNA-binding IclR family transcriptional regulator